MKFLCSQCGACCRKAGELGGAKYGLPIKEDGSCGHLKNNLCSIYEERPDVCNSNKLPGKKPSQSKKEYFIENTLGCHKLIDAEGLDSKYKIDIKEYN